MEPYTREEEAYLVGTAMGGAGGGRSAVGRSSLVAGHRGEREREGEGKRAREVAA